MEPSNFCEGRPTLAPSKLYPHGLHLAIGHRLLLGFAFGVGCALAVMYSIYTGGYRAALRDTYTPVPPKRLREALDHLHLPQPSKAPSNPAPPTEP